VRDLLLHERLFAKLMVTDRTIERLVDGFERDGFDRFVESLAEPEMKSLVTRAVNAAVVNFLRIPPAERLRRFSPARRAALADTLGDWLVRVARDGATRDAMVTAVDRLLEAAERRTWVTCWDWFRRSGWPSPRPTRSPARPGGTGSRRR